MWEGIGTYTGPERGDGMAAPLTPHPSSPTPHQTLSFPTLHTSMSPTGVSIGSVPRYDFTRPCRSLPFHPPHQLPSTPQ